MRFFFELWAVLLVVCLLFGGVWGLFAAEFRGFDGFGLLVLVGFLDCGGV